MRVNYSKLISIGWKLTAILALILVCTLLEYFNKNSFSSQMMVPGTTSPQDQLESFVRRADRYGIKLGIEPDKIKFYYSKIQTDQPRTAVLGICSKKEIYIEKDHWDRFSDLLREQLIFHELGHCLLNLAHRNEILRSGRPKSLMHARKFMREATYKAHRSNYHLELFSPLSGVFRQLSGIYR